MPANEWIVYDAVDQEHHFYDTEDEAIKALDKLRNEHDQHAREDGEYSDEAEGCYIAQVTHRIELTPVDEAPDGSVGYTALIVEN